MEHGAENIQHTGEAAWAKAQYKPIKGCLWLHVYFSAFYMQGAPASVFSDVGFRSSMIHREAVHFDSISTVPPPGGIVKKA